MKRISLKQTGQDLIELLEELEPGVDHSCVKDKPLIEVKKKHAIGPLKNPQPLIKAPPKAAGEEMAEKAKQEAVEAAKMKARRTI